MKKTLLLTAFLVLSSITGYASTVVVTFGVNTLDRGMSTFTGTYLGESGSVNLIMTGNNGQSYTSSGLTAFDGDSTGITITTGAGACGGPGCLTTGNVKDSYDSTQNPNKFFDIFGANMATGDNGGCINVGSGGYTMQLGGLSSGVYTLTMLVGRGNTSYGTASSTYTLDGTGITGLSANILDHSAGMSASLDGTDLTLGRGEGDWALVEYTFTVTADNTTLNLKSEGSGNIGALALASVPEPATASLGLLGLGVLLIRRRRA